MATWRPGKHKDPVTAASFFLEIQGHCTGTFKECTGLGSESEVITHTTADNGGKVVIQKIPGNLKWGEITLKRGVTDDMAIWDWRKMIEDGKVISARASGTVTMYNQANEAVAEWTFDNSWPVKVTGPTMNASTNDIAVEELTIAHEGMRRVGV